MIHPGPKIKQADPDNSGRTLGWGVYKAGPWVFKGLYGSEAEAKAAAKIAGAEYKVAYGSNRDGTEDFMH